MKSFSNYNFTFLTLLLRQVQENSDKQAVFQSYPYPPAHTPTPNPPCDIGSEVFEDLTPHKPLRAMLRPCFRELDLMHWRKASVDNSKWVGFLSAEETDRFYEGERNQKHIHPSGGEIGREHDASSEKSMASIDEVPHVEAGIGTNTEETTSAKLATELGSKSTNSKILGMAVIKNAIVVNSTAYLQVEY